MRQNHRCAVCDSENVIREESIPIHWEDYLRENHGYIPHDTPYAYLCKDCHPRFHTYRHQRAYGRTDTDHQPTQELLDDLILDNLEIGHQ
jgi:uncharacterized protein YlaI